MTTVLLTGVRGNTGRLVAPLLAQRGATVKGGTRDPRELAAVDAGAADASADSASAITPVRFDWRDDSTWRPALDGADAVYVARPEVGDAPELVGGLLDAAGADVRVVLLSDDIHGASVPPDSWEGRVERAVSERVANWTLLRPSWFHQVLIDERYFRVPIRDAGELEIPTGGAGIAFVDARDIAEVAVATLLQDGHSGRAYDLTGPAAVTLGQVTEQLSAVAGHGVRHVDTPLAEAVAAFAQSDDADPWYVDYIDHVWSIMRSGSAAALSDDVERVLGRPPRSMAAFIDEHAAVWRRSGGH